MDLDATLCHCFHISRRKIVNFTLQRRPPRASQLSGCFGAGSGCGWCIPYLIRIHQDIMAGRAVEADDITPAQYEEMRARYRAQVAGGERKRNQYAEDSPPGGPSGQESGGLA